MWSIRKEFHFSRICPSSLLHLYPHTLTFTTVLWINCPSVLYFGTGSHSFLPIQTICFCSYSLFLLPHQFLFFPPETFTTACVHAEMSLIYIPSLILHLPLCTTWFIFPLLYQNPSQDITIFFLHFLFSFIQIIFLSQKSTKALMMIKKIPFILLRPTIHFHFTYDWHISSIWCRWLHPPSDTPFSLVFFFWPHCLFFFFLVSYSRL